MSNPFIRIIPRLEIKENFVVKGYQYEGVQKIDYPEKLALKYYQENADEIIFIDTVASLYGRNTLNDVIKKVDTSNKPFVSETENGKVFKSDSIIIATGAQARWLKIPNEEKFRGFGISACATCDGFFYKDKKVAVVGGGNAAVEEALFLTKFASNVTLIHRRDNLRAEKMLQEKLKSNKKINIIKTHKKTPLKTGF